MWPQVAYQEKAQQRYPRTLLALGALDLAGRGEKVTAESILETLLRRAHHRDLRCMNVVGVAGAAGTGAADSGDRAGLAAGAIQHSFARVAGNSLGLTRIV